MFADFDAYLAVYMGSSDRNMTCVSAGHFSFGGGTSNFVAQIDTEYSVLVGGAHEYATGDYTLVLTGDGDCEDTSNDSCENAVIVNEDSFPLSSSNMQFGDMQYQQLPRDCFLHSDWRTSWYQLQLDGSATSATCLRLSVDMEGYGRVVVLSGTCESPRCVQSRDGYGASLSLKVNASETYLLGVSGRERGNSFSLDLKRFDCVENDVCDTAAYYRSFPIVKRTSLEFAVEASWDSPGHACPSFPERGTWYRFEGTGNCVTVDVWGIGRPYISVYTGSDCRSLSCLSEERGSDQPLSFHSSVDVSFCR